MNYESNKKLFGRVCFALGAPEAGYVKLSKGDQWEVAQGWNIEYERNLVRLKKVYEGSEDYNRYYDEPCMNKYNIDLAKFRDHYYKYAGEAFNA